MSIDVSLLPERYQKQIAAQVGGRVVGVAVADSRPAKNRIGGHIVEVKPEPARRRLRQDRRGLNQTEEAFLAHLLATKPNCNPRREGLGIRIGNGCVYWPDFVIGIGPEALEAYEVKGPWMQDDSSAKLKSAAREFPEVRFFLATREEDKSGWIIEEVLP